MVSDSHKIVWCNTGPWLPRIRTEAEVCDYYLRKEKLHITTARETYTVKVEVGDRGDNLMPGTPLRFFDLYEEDQEWGWTTQEEEEIRRIIADVKPSNRPDHLTNSKKFLTAVGMFLPEIPPPAQIDVALFAERSRRERREALVPDLKGLSKKYCIALEDDSDFTKCSRVAIDDIKALEQIKALEEKKKSDPVNFCDGDKGLLKSLKQSRKDYKATLLRFDAKIKTLGLAH